MLFHPVLYIGTMVADPVSGIRKSAMEAVFQERDLLKIGKEDLDFLSRLDYSKPRLYAGRVHLESAAIVVQTAEHLFEL